LAGWEVGDSSVVKNPDLHSMERRFEPHCWQCLFWYRPLASPSLQIASVASKHYGKNKRGAIVNKWLRLTDPYLSTIPQHHDKLGDEKPAFELNTSLIKLHQARRFQCSCTCNIISQKFEGIQHISFILRTRLSLVSFLLTGT